MKKFIRIEQFEAWVNQAVEQGLFWLELARHPKYVWVYVSED